nr:MAG TPA: hypothetical protein [Caudoviricetes sp.]
MSNTSKTRPRRQPFCRRKPRRAAQDVERQAVGIRPKRGQKRTLAVTLIVKMRAAAK